MRALLFETILRSVSGVLDDDVVTGEDMRDARALSLPCTGSGE